MSQIRYLDNNAFTISFIKKDIIAVIRTPHISCDIKKISQNQCRDIVYQKKLCEYFIATVDSTVAMQLFLCLTGYFMKVQIKRKFFLFQTNNDNIAFTTLKLLVAISICN